MASVYDYIERVRARPSMYLDDHSVEQLESSLVGYYNALDVHGIDERVPALSRHFAAWLEHRKSWHFDYAWADAVIEHTEPGQDPLALFFALADEYRSLEPVTLDRVELTTRHQPTGLRSVIGASLRIARPDVVELVQYRPEPLFFFRFYFGSVVRVQDIIIDNGRCAESVDSAKRWLADELSVRPSDWDSAHSR